jgi:putative chitinase
MSFDIAKFFTEVRNGLGVGKGILGPKLEPGEVEGCEAILKAMAGTPISHCAYALATAYHETARTMQPVLEAYWLSEGWRKRNLRYYPWHGRGYVQLTWKENYARADSEAAAAGLIAPGDLLAKPDLAMRPDLAAFIMRRGMVEGWFTASKDGRRHTLERHLPLQGGNPEQFEAARRIINGTDKAQSIAVYAMQFQLALLAGGW